MTAKKTTAKQATKSTSEATGKAATKKKATKSAAKKITKSAAKKTTKSAAKKTTKSAAKKTTKSAAKKTTKAAAKKTTKTAAKKTTKSAAKKTATKRAPKSPAKKSPTKRAPKSPAKQPRKSVAKQPPKQKPAKPPGKHPGYGAFAAKIAAIEARAVAGGVTLPGGASEKAIAQAEAALGFTLPVEARAWFAAHDGGGDQLTVVDNRELLSLKRVVSEWKIWKQLLDDGVFEGNDHSDPGPGVQQKWWIPAWIPVSYDGAGNHDVLDLAPAEGGVVGQIISFWHDDGERNVLAPDMLEWLLGAEWKLGW